MQNFRLLEEFRATEYPILLKRHFGCSLEELYAATTYFLEGHDLWVCERSGVHPFQHGYRYNLDLMGVAEWRRLHPKIPIYVDVSHWMGSAWAEDHWRDKAKMITTAAQGAKAMGAHGILVDVHEDPPKAWTDPWQALTFDEFKRLVEVLQ